MNNYKIRVLSGDNSHLYNIIADYYRIEFDTYAFKLDGLNVFSSPTSRTIIEERKKL